MAGWRLCKWITMSMYSMLHCMQDDLFLQLGMRICHVDAPVKYNLRTRKFDEYKTDKAW
jgi:hypothetical protein